MFSFGGVTTREQPGDCMVYALAWKIRLPTTKPNWFFEWLCNSKQTSNTTGRFQ